MQLVLVRAIPCISVVQVLFQAESIATIYTNRRSVLAPAANSTANFAAMGRDSIKFAVKFTTKVTNRGLLGQALTKGPVLLVTAEALLAAQIAGQPWSAVCLPPGLPCPR